ncbi:polyamine-modulated factor 1 isoform X2 [Lingula anatina]|uniref:Polyamine-modulated factor 1 isoform X2 n=1 Tax=Lingula anatina TaxID=7574 RepID=A0A1S3J6K8_LINAN|nr:polyamine-modulated factor 1 isoform X2 [Lingula anatina]|eukprot:XP_013406025.1 polyamine-modulated factor 1 isoform X2 [Lingula anatina]
MEGSTTDNSGSTADSSGLRIPAAVDNIENKSTDVAEGRHATLLRQALEKTVQKCLSSGRFSAFARNFKAVYDKNPKALKNIHTQFMHQLESAITEEIDTLFEEENIVGLMNELDKLISEAPLDLQHPAWRPTGNPEADIQSHLIQVKQVHKETLQSILEDLEEESARLKEAVLSKRHQLLNTQQAVQNKVKGMDQAVDVCKEMPTKEIWSYFEETSK